MAMLRPDEFVHVVERRVFQGDSRRHFIGRIETAADRAIRVRGYLFAYDSGLRAFVRKPEVRTRIIALDDSVIVNVLWPSLDPDHVRHRHDSDDLPTTGDGGIDLDFGEFSPKC